MSKISIDFELNSTINPEFHKEKIEFACFILDYVNSRLKSSVSLVYSKDGDNFKFHNSTETDYNYVFDCSSFVNYSTMWFIQKRDLDEDWLKFFIDNVSQKADSLKSPIYASMVLNRLTEIEIAVFLEQKAKFKAIYEDFDCYTFLSKQQQEKIKTELNSICYELDEVV
jgi:hypothetical protein